MYKKILIGVGSALGSAGLLVGGTALIANNKALSDFFKYPWGSVYEETSDKLNNYDGVIQMYKKKVEELNTEITELRSNLSNITIEKNNLQNEIKSLTAERDKYLNDIDLLEKEKLSNNEKISLLNAQILELEDENETLAEDKSSLLLQVESLTKENNDKQTEIDSLNQQVATLNSSLNNANSLITEKDNEISQLESDLLIQTNEVTRLNGLIDSYNEMASVSYEVQFYAGDTLLSACAVKSGEKVLTTKIPTNEEYRIDGWKLSDGTSVDPLNYEITEDTIFYADYVRQYNVTFIDGETTLFTGKLGTDRVSYTAPEKDGYSFWGWICSVDGKTYTDLSTYELTQDVTFYAQYYTAVSAFYDSRYESGSPYGITLMPIFPDGGFYDSAMSAAYDYVSESYCESCDFKYFDSILDYNRE